jgi:hypothetical protein
MMPIVVASMGIFPNTTLANLGYDFSDSKDIYGILMEIVTPNPVSTGVTIPVINYTITVQMSLYVIIGILAVVALARSTAIPTVVGIISAVLIVPFIVDVGMVFYGEAESYHSTPLSLMIIAIIVGVLAMGILTLLEMSKGTDQSMED